MIGARRGSLFAAALLAGCGPQGAGDGAADSEASTSDGGSSSDTGEPVCTPWTAAALDWQRRRGDPGMPAAGEAAIVAIDDAGRIVAAITDAIEDDSDVSVTSFAAGGASAWTLRYEGMAGLADEVLDVAVAGDGSIYVAVREQTRELISEGFGNVAEYTLVVLAIDPEGTRRWRWSREIPPPMYNSNARMAGIAVDAAGLVVVVDADATSESDGIPVLTELDRWGNEIRGIDLGTVVEEVQRLDVAIGPSGVLHVVGTVYGENWITRVQRDGTIDWEDRAAPSGVRATAVASGAGDEAYVLLANGDAEAGDAGLELRRYEPDGTVAWSYEMPWPTGDGFPAAVTIDCDGAPIVAGEITAYDSGTDPARTAWIAGISTAGALAWSSTIEDARPIAPRSIARAADGTLVLGGLEGGAELGPWIARLTTP